VINLAGLHLASGLQERLLIMLNTGHYRFFMVSSQQWKGAGVPCFCGRDIAWRLGSCDDGGLMAGNIYISLCSVLGKFFVLAKYLVTLNKENI